MLEGAFRTEEPIARQPSPCSSVAALGSAPTRLSQCRLHGRIQRAEKPRAIPLGQRSGSAGIRSEFTQVAGDLTTDQCVTYIGLRPAFPGWGDDARPLLRKSHVATAPICGHHRGPRR